MTAIKCVTERTYRVELTVEHLVDLLKVAGFFAEGENLGDVEAELWLPGPHGSCQLETRLPAGAELRIMAEMVEMVHLDENGSQVEPPDAASS